MRTALVGITTLAALVVVGVAVVRSISVDRVDAVWAVSGEVGESSQAIPIRAAHPSCSSWSSLGGLVVTAVETDDVVTVTASFPSHPSDVDCEWIGNSMPAVVKLDEPLGDRALVDGATGRDPATPATMAFHTGRSPRNATTPALGAPVLEN